MVHILKNTALFRGIQPEEIEAMLPCLQVHTASFEKKAVILQAGDSISAVALLVEGTAYIVQEDFWGNRNIVSAIGPGQLFAEAFACTPGARLLVSVIAETSCTVAFLQLQPLLTPCGKACAFHTRVVHNLLADLAEKNLRLSEKLSHVTQRTTREKLLAYLSAESIRQGGSVFDIPYNWQQLADYLAVERSAMCAVLSGLQAEGILRYSGRRFELLDRREP